MPNRWIITLKVLVHAACLWPALWLLRGLFSSASALGPDPIAYVTHATGFLALRVLVISLAITPVRKLIPKLSWLIRFRRLLGLYGFFFASLHLLVYVGLYSGFSWAGMLDDLKQRPFIWAGFTAWVLLLPLALTSSAWSIRKLGGKRWQALHRLAYIAAIAGVAHYWWIVKPGVRTPMTMTLVLGVLLAVRPVLGWVQMQRKAAVPARAS